MLIKKIKYIDYNGVEREESFLFNLTKAELFDMEMGKYGGLATKIRRLIETQDAPEIIKIFKDIILSAYGEKSDDGKRFMKCDNEGHSLAQNFAQTEAFSVLYMELATDSKAASEFIKGIIPADLDLSEMEEQIAGQSPNPTVTNS